MNENIDPIPHHTSPDDDAVILKMAMRKEEFSILFYEVLFKIVERADTKALLRDLIKEEKGHFKMLREAMLTGNRKKIGIPLEPESLEMTDYLVSEDIDHESKPIDIVRLAIRREEDAEEFYLGRIGALQDKDLKKLYQRLAQEEINHKKKWMKIYDDLSQMKNA